MKLQGKFFSDYELDHSSELTLGGDPSAWVVFTDAISPLAASFKDDRLDQACVAVKEAVSQYLEGFSEEGLSQEIVQEAFDFAAQLCQERLTKDAITVSVLVLSPKNESAAEGDKEHWIVYAVGDLRLYYLDQGKLSIAYQDPLNAGLSLHLDASERTRDLSNAIAAAMQPEVSFAEISLPKSAELLILPYGIYGAKKLQPHFFKEGQETLSQLGSLVEVKERKLGHRAFLAYFSPQPLPDISPESADSIIEEMPKAQAAIDALPTPFGQKNRPLAYAAALAAASFLTFLAICYQGKETPGDALEREDAFVQESMADSASEIVSAPDSLESDALVFELLNQNAEQKEMIAKLRDEMQQLEMANQSQEAEPESFSPDDFLLEIELKNEKISQLQQSLQSLERELSLQQTENEVDRLQEELASLKKVEEEHDKVISLLAHLQEEVEVLRQELDGKNELIETKDQIIAKEEQRIAQLEREESKSHVRRTLKENQQEIKALQKQNGQLHQALNQKEIALAQQTERLGVLTALSHMLHVKPEEPSRLKGEVNKLLESKKEQASLQKDVEEQLHLALEEKDVLLKECQRLTNKTLEMDDLAAKQSEDEHRMEQLQKELQHKDQQIAHLAGEVQDLKAAHFFLEEEKNGSLQKLAAAEDAQRKYEEEMRARLNLENTKQQLAHQIELKDQAERNLKEKQVALQKQLDALIKKNLRLESEMAIARNEQALSPNRFKAPIQAVKPLSEPALAAREVKEQEHPSRTHKVAKGETLTGISKIYYGTSKRWFDIYTANQERIKDKNRIAVGSELVIPE
jgi:hypothetical protein